MTDKERIKVDSAKMGSHYCLASALELILETLQKHGISDEKLDIAACLIEEARETLSPASILIGGEAYKMQMVEAAVKRSNA